MNSLSRPHTHFLLGRPEVTVWSMTALAAGAGALIQQLLSAGSASSAEARLLDWLLLALAIVAVLVCGRLQLRAARAPDATEVLLRSFEHLPCHVLVAANRGWPERASQRHLDFLGLKRDDIRGNECLKWIHMDDRERARAAWSSCQNDLNPRDIEYRIRRNDGEYHWFQIHLEPLISAANGECIATIGILTEIGRWKAMEEALRNSEQSLRRLVDTVPAMIWHADATGELLYVNNRCYEFHGVSAEQQRELQWVTLIHPDDRAMVMAEWNVALQSRQHMDVTYRYRRKDGVYRWMAVRASPLIGEEGGVLTWYGIHTDISDLKHTEHALRDSERRLNLLIETMPAMCWRTTPQGEVDFVNRRALEILGTDSSSLAQFGWISNVHVDDLPAVMKQWHSCIENAKSFEAIYRYKYADGRYHWSRVTCAPLCDEQTGAIISWYGAHVDIDEQIKTQELLRDRARELHAILDAMPGLAWRATPAGEMQYANRQCTAYTGISFEQLAQFGWQHTVHPEDLDHVMRTWQRSAETGEPFRVVNRYKRFDGVYRWFDVRANPFRDELGQITHWYGIDLDIDESKKTEEMLRIVTAKLARASQIATIGELAATIAHEINQPLAAVASNAEACINWLAGDPPNLSRVKSSAEAIVRNGRSAAAVIKRVRGLFKHAPPATECLDANDIIVEVIHMMGDELRRKATRVETRLAQGLPRVRADRVQVQQVLINLVQNAIDSMEALNEEPKVVRLTSDLANPTAVTVSVSDVGCGFGDDEKIFEPFFTTKDNGLGIGLSVCRSIIEAHGGKLSASLNDPRGATFEFTIPVESASQ